MQYLPSTLGKQLVSSPLSQFYIIVQQNKTDKDILMHKNTELFDQHISKVFLRVFRFSPLHKNQNFMRFDLIRVIFVCVPN